MILEWRVIDYGPLIKRLYERSGLQVNQYAALVNYTVAHISNIINGHQRGSPKVLEACLKNAGLEFSQLQLPEVQEQTEEEKEILRRFRKLSPVRRALALGVLKQFVDAERRLKNK